jgi:hypothetical protein
VRPVPVGRQPACERPDCVLQLAVGHYSPRRTVTHRELVWLARADGKDLRVSGRSGISTSGSGLG